MTPPGRHYTPPGVADLLCAITAAPGAQRIWDPTCGDGSLLDAARRAGHHSRTLIGTDLDADGIAAARQRLPGARFDVADLFTLQPADLGGFDTILGNPPFARHEEGFGDAAHRAIATRWGGTAPKRLDLAHLALLHCLSFLRPGGRLGFVLPSSALDSESGRWLRKRTAATHPLVLLVDSEVESWFATAAVTTVLAVFQRRENPTGPGPRAWAVRLQAAASARIAPAVLGQGTVPGVQRVPLAPDEVRPMSRLRSGPIWEEVRSRVGSTLGPLGAAPVDLRYGIKPGITDFYAPDDPGTFDRAGVEALFQRPFLGSLADWADHEVRSEVVPGRILDVGVAPVDLEDPAVAGLARWVSWGATQQTRGGVPWPEAPSVRTRKAWWRLQAPRIGTTIIPQFRHDRHFVLANPDRVGVNNACWTAEPRSEGVSLPGLWCWLNSSIVALAAEIEGRSNLGEGLLTLYGPDLEQLPVPLHLEGAAFQAWGAAWEGFRTRPIERWPDERLRPERKALDAATDRVFDLPSGTASACGEEADRLLGVRLARAAARRDPSSRRQSNVSADNRFKAED